MPAVLDVMWILSLDVTIFVVVQLNLVFTFSAATSQLLQIRNRHLNIESFPGKILNFRNELGRTLMVLGSKIGSG